MALKKTSKPRSDGFAFLDSKTPWTGYSMLLFGPPGSGKTYLSGTSVLVPEMNKVLLVDNDGGSRTVRGKKRFEGIKILRVHSGSGITPYNHLFAWLNNDPRGAGTEVRKNFASQLGPSEQYKTIIIDNLGSLHESIVLDILENMPRNRTDPETPSLQDYGTARSRMRKMFHHFAKYSEDNNVTFIFTCHVDIVKNEYEVIAKLRPALPGKLSYEIPGDLPIVGYIDVESGRKKIGQQGQAPEGGTRVVTFDPRSNPKLEVKDQSEKLGLTLSNPTMAQIHKLLF